MVSSSRCRFQLKEVPGTEKVWPAQLVLLALGFLGPDDTVVEQFALERDPRNTEAMYQLARLAREAGDLEIAGERFRSVLQLAPGHLPSLNALIRMALDAGLPGEVVSLVERARDANPESPGLHLQLADLYTQQGRSLDALGFETEWVEAPGTDRAGHLIASHRGNNLR